MIDRKKSKNLIDIFTYAGKHICTSVNPISEAQQWIKAHLSTIKNNEQLIILGAGCGYHIQRLLIEYPQKNILVIEKEEEIFRACLDLHSIDIAAVQFIVNKSREEIMANHQLSSALRKSYGLLCFKPACSPNPSYYDGIQNLFLGRDQDSFAFLKQKKEYSSFIQIRQPAIQQQPLSIKDIEVVGDQSESAALYYCHQIMRELVL